MKPKINLKLLIITPLAVIAFGAITVLVLSKLAPQKAKTDSSTQIAIAKPADIIKQFQASRTIEELATAYTKLKTPVAGPELINYTADKSYTIYVRGSDFVQFEQKDKTLTRNSTTVLAKSDTFLTGKSLKKMTQSTDGLLFSVYDSDKTVCQLFDSPSYSDKGATLTLSCVDKSEITKQYATINKLLALYPDEKSAIATPTGIIMRTTTEGDKKLTVTDIYGAKTESGAVSLIFAAIGDKWEYIGKRAISSGDIVVDNSLSAVLKARLNDAKYGDFLNKNIK